MPNSRTSQNFEERSTPAVDFIQMKVYNGIKNGIRRLFIKREDSGYELRKELYNKREGFTILTKHRGQQQTCKQCDEIGHQRAQFSLLIKTRPQEKPITGSLAH